MISKWLIAPFLLCGELLTSQLMADQDVEDVVIPEEQAVAEKGIRGIFITSDRADIVPGGRPDKAGINLVDFNVKGSSEELVDLLQEFMGLPMTKKNVIAIKQKIMKYYVDRDNSMIGIEIPAQKTIGGVVQILVIQKHYGKSIWKGCAIYSINKMEDILCIDPYDLDEVSLRNNLSWINKNNFQSVNMKFIKGDQPDIVDIEFTSKARPVVRPYVKGDNTGSSSGGWGRMAAGVNWGNALWMGDTWSFEYKTSNEVERLCNFTSTYLCILPWKNFFSVFGTYSRSRPVNRNAKIRSISWQVKPKYDIPIGLLYKPLQQSITFEYAWKYKSNTTRNLLPPFSTRVRKQFVTPFGFNYTMFNRIKNHSLSLYFNLYGQPFTYLEHQSHRVYNMERRHSKPKFVYANLTLGDVISFKNRSAISIQFRGQLAPRTLPNTELFGAGGYSSVRGYNEGKLSGDNGFYIQSELRSPPWKFSPKGKGEIKLLAFMDYGLVNNLYVQQSRRPGAKRIPHTQDIWGVGPGLRYTVGTNFQLRCDYGIKLLDVFGQTAKQRRMINRGFGELHIGALLSY